MDINGETHCNRHHLANELSCALEYTLDSMGCIAFFVHLLRKHVEASFRQSREMLTLLHVPCDIALCQRGLSNAW